MPREGTAWTEPKLGVFRRGALLMGWGQRCARGCRVWVRSRPQGVLQVTARPWGVPELRDPPGQRTSEQVTDCNTGSLAETHRFIEHLLCARLWARCLG